MALAGNSRFVQKVTEVGIWQINLLWSPRSSTGSRPGGGPGLKAGSWVGHLGVPYRCGGKKGILARAGQTMQMAKKLFNQHWVLEKEGMTTPTGISIQPLSKANGHRPVLSKANGHHPDSPGSFLEHR